MMPEALSRSDLARYALNHEQKQILSSNIKPPDILAITRDGFTLSHDSMFGFIHGITSGSVEPGQIGAWLMAVRMRENTTNPLSLTETVDLTLAMAASGEVLDLDEFGIVADKHSSGGVGDKTTLVVAPMVAALGITVGKMSGRGLEHTGGTLDKLESIPGFRVDLSKKEFLEQIRKVGIVVTGQTGELAPADRILYAMRDVTATVDCIPLIAASIMSKKIASGANHLVLDVKVGEGAFMKTLEDAQKLARTMVDIGKNVGIKVIAEISDMNQPLGEAVGNALEVLESIQTLKGEGPADFQEHCIDTAARIVLLAGKAGDMDEARELVNATLHNGSATEKFRAMVRAQGGDERVVDDPLNILKIATAHPVYMKGTGYIADVNPMTVGLTAMNLGGGRMKITDKIDHSVGVKVRSKVGAQLDPKEPVFYIYSDDPEKIRDAEEKLRSSITLSDTPVEPLPLIYGVVE